MHASVIFSCTKIGKIEGTTTRRHKTHMLVISYSVSGLISLRETAGLLPRPKRWSPREQVLPWRAMVSSEDPCKERWQRAAAMWGTLRYISLTERELRKKEGTEEREVHRKKVTKEVQKKVASGEFWVFVVTVTIIINMNYFKKELIAPD